MSPMPSRARTEIAPPVLLGVLAAATVVAFLISLAVGPSGLRLRPDAARPAR